MAKILTDHEITLLFAKKYSQEAIQTVGIGSHNGKKCVRVVVYRPAASTVKLPKTFKGLKVDIVLTDGKARSL